MCIRDSIWTLPDDSTFEGQELSLQNATNMQSGTYMATSEFANGCSFTQTYELDLAQIPIAPMVINQSGDNTICLGEEITFSASYNGLFDPSTDNYNWMVIADDNSCINVSPLSDQQTFSVQGLCTTSFEIMASITIGDCTSDTVVFNDVFYVVEAPAPEDDDYQLEYEASYQDDVTLNDAIFPASFVVNPPQYQVTILTDVQQGTLVMENDGRFTYTPADGYIGRDQFVYQVCFEGCEEEEELCEFAIVTLNITDSRCIVPTLITPCLLYTSPSPRDLSTSRMPSSA